MHTEKVVAVSCNRTAVNKVGTNKTRSHHFEVQDQIKVSGIKEVLETMYNWILMNPGQRFMM